jgi:methionyl-tRNA formyltransferase
MMTNLKVGFFGDGPWSHLALDKLTTDPTIEVVFVCTRFKVPDTSLIEKAKKRQIPILAFRDINTLDAHKTLSEFHATLFVSMSFNQIFREPLLTSVKFGVINCHAGKLPFYRGRNILNWVLINDEKEFGITVHYVDLGIDTGDIILQKTFHIGDEDNYQTLLTRAYKECGLILYQSIKLIQIGKAERTPQDTIDSYGSYFVKRKQGDEIIDWTRSSREIFNFVRAICKPGPQAQTSFGNQIIYINEVEYLPNAKHNIGIPGSILHVASDSLIVKTGDSFIKVISWSGAGNPKVGDRLQ